MESIKKNFCNDCKLSPMSDRYCTDCAVFQNWEKDKKDRLLRLWAEKKVKCYYHCSDRQIETQYYWFLDIYGHNSLPNIPDLMIQDGVSEEEINKIMEG